MSFSSETKVVPADPATRYRTVIFIDFWNFEGHLRSVLGRDHADLTWDAFSVSLVTQVERALSAWSKPVKCDLEGTRVYAAPKGDRYTQKWFRDHIALAPRYYMELKKRQKTKARCLDCGARGHRCLECGHPLIFDQEKGVDAALVTDLLWLAWQDLYDLAIVVSSDSDLIAGIERVQLSGRKVVNARFAGIGNDVAQASWTTINFDWLFQGREAREVWDVPGLWSGIFEGVLDGDPNKRLLRGENPRKLLTELRETQWFESLEPDSYPLKTIERIEQAAKKARYPIPS